MSQLKTLKIPIKYDGEIQTQIAIATVSALAAKIDLIDQMIEAETNNMKKLHMIREFSRQLIQYRQFCGLPVSYKDTAQVVTITHEDIHARLTPDEIIKMPTDIEVVPDSTLIPYEKQN